MIEGNSYAFQKHNHWSIRGTIIRKGNLETHASWPDDCPTADYVKSFEVQVKCGYNYRPSLSFPFHLSVPTPLSQPQQCSQNVNMACVLVPPKQALRISQTFFFHRCRLQNKVVRTIPNCYGLLQPLWSCCHSFSFCRIRTNDKSHWHGLPL